MSSQQKSLLIDSPTQLSGAKRTLADDDAQSTNGVVIATNTNDGINKLVTAA